MPISKVSIPPVRDNPVQTLKDLRPDVLDGGMYISTSKCEEYLGPLMGTRLTFAGQNGPIAAEGWEIDTSDSPWSKSIRAPALDVAHSCQSVLFTS